MIGFSSVLFTRILPGRRRRLNVSTVVVSTVVKPESQSSATFSESRYKRFHVKIVTTIYYIISYTNVILAAILVSVQFETVFKQ